MYAVLTTWNERRKCEKQQKEMTHYSLELSKQYMDADTESTAYKEGSQREQLTQICCFF